MRRCINRATLCAAMLLLAGGPLHAGLITVGFGNAFANADKPVLNEYYDSSFYLSLPVHQAVTSSLSDGTFATTVANLDEQNGNTILEFQFDHRRTGYFGESATASSAFSVDFTAIKDASYDASGFYRLTSGTNLISYSVYLIDHTAGNTPFGSLQTSDHTPNEDFYVGGTGGDLDPGRGSNEWIGSLHGTLLAGHQYQLAGTATIQTFNFTNSFNVWDTGATAKGALTFVIGPAERQPTDPRITAPEPASAALFGLGGLGLMAPRRRQKRFAG